MLSIFSASLLVRFFAHWLRLLLNYDQSTLSTRNRISGLWRKWTGCSLPKRYGLGKLKRHFASSKSRIWMWFGQEALALPRAIPGCWMRRLQHTSTLCEFFRARSTIEFACSLAGPRDAPIYGMRLLCGALSIWLIIERTSCRAARAQLQSRGQIPHLVK